MKEASDKFRARRCSTFSVSSRRPAGLGIIQEKYEEAGETVVSLKDQRFKIYDSHAVDYSRYANVTKKSSLPASDSKKTKPKDAKKKQQKELKDTEKEADTLSTKECERKVESLSLTGEEEDTEYLSVSRVESRRSSLNSHRLSVESFSGSFLKQPTQSHDTLASFIKYYRAQRQKDDKLKSIQSRAKVKTPRNTESKAEHSSKKAESILPPIRVRIRQTETTGSPQIHKNRWKRQLPKVLSEKRKRHIKKNIDSQKDPRFERLISTLEPVYNRGESTTLPLLVPRRKRSYTTS